MPQHQLYSQTKGKKVLYANKSIESSQAKKRCATKNVFDIPSDTE